MQAVKLVESELRVQVVLRVSADQQVVAVVQVTVVAVVLVE